MTQTSAEPRALDAPFAPDYTEQILHRGRVMMEPKDFAPNWLDKPRKQKFYPQAARTPLPTYVGTERAVQAAFTGNAGSAPVDDLAELAAMLQYSYGLINRRLGIQANTDLGGLPFYADAGWARGTASGGGLYPISVYYVAGRGSDLAPGIYHYSPMHHAFAQLLAGDVTGTVTAALTQPVRHTGSYFVLGLKYWQNAFKYNSFSFHAVTMDLGTILSTWTMWSRASGHDLTANLWFDEARLADLLGVENTEEGIYAVVPLRSRDETAPGSEPLVSVRSRVQIADQEHSSVSYGFDAVERMQRESAATAELSDVARAAVETVARPRRRIGPVVELPPATPLSGSLPTVLSQRRSSFGRFVAAPLAAADLHALLQAAATSGLHTDACADSSALTSVYVFVNHVSGVPKGAYLFDRTGSLVQLDPQDQGKFLQDNYFLANYNLEQAGAVIVPAVPTHDVLAGTGARGYRLVNASVGAVSQATYTASAALGVGCGVALGFDNISFIERLKLESGGEKPLLIMAVGAEHGCGNYRAEMV